MDNYSNRNKGCQNYHRPIRISNTSESRNAASRNGKRETNSNFLLCKHAPSLFADANLDASILSDARYGYKRGRGGGDRGKTRNAAESFVADYRSIFEQVHSTGLSLPLSLEIFFLRDYHGNPFPDTCHISPPVKIHFPEHDTFEDAARAAHYPLPALHPPLSFSLSMLSIRFEIVKFHRFTNYRSRSPLLHSKVVSVSIRISLIFFLRSSFVGGNVFRRLGSRG